jgi:carbamoyl-phosphate synthase small subunit
LLATLALETGEIYAGRLFGAPHSAGGEVVFHTGMTGYQEILTDPSYAGQIVVFTASHIGNYGIHAGHEESARIHPTAVIVRDHCRRTFHRQADHSLDDVLRRAVVPGLADVDTRALTTRLREGGTCRGVVGTAEPEQLVGTARALPQIVDVDWVDRVTARDIWRIEPARSASGAGDPFEVAALDLGVKQSILIRLAHEGCRVRVFPASTPAEALLAPPTEGVLLSNGPGDPSAIPHIVGTARALVGSGLPIFGICLGHQVLARALGATTTKLHFGHHGANHPVRRLADNRVEITSQNHNYAVPVDSIDAKTLRITHLSLNDQTVEGFEVIDRPIYAVQYHPEAAPGPRDSHYLFRRFCDDMAARRARTRRRRGPAGGGRGSARKGGGPAQERRGSGRGRRTSDTKT